MAQLVWDEEGKHFFETGVDHGVLFVNKGGQYQSGVAWSGLTGVSEHPSGAAATSQYADNSKYLSLISAETFSGTITAYTYPDEFTQCDGTAELKPGINVGQQRRLPFALVYRTKIGNDTSGQDFSYKLHILYGLTAAPSERQYATVNDSPSAMTLSWTVSSTPVQVANLKPTSVLSIDARKADPGVLKKIEDKLFGTNDAESTLLMPDAIAALTA